MLHKLFVTLLVLGLGASTASAQQTLPYPRPVPTPPLPSGYWVQFRQPEWRQQTFATEFEMVNFINSQRALGWEVQVVPSPLGPFSVRYRLTQWGGSRTVPTMAAAQEWAAILADQGYQPRIVPLSQ
jgi:hypothetical protein